ncbi:MAG: hypothetical protein EA383_11825 [Spirochaetaceae bacterium]|nr:MAG: hypothetical protein EA383_11825 [Spirochaetaceae bacterium]
MNTFCRTVCLSLRTYIILFLCIGMCGALVKVQADETPGSDIRSASQASLFAYGRPDPRVEVFLDGSWQTGAALQLGLRRVATEDTTGSWTMDQVSLPGFASRTFSNIVDLTLSVRLDDRYYFETVFIDEFDLDSMLFGYDGQNDEFVQRVRIGLGPIAIDQYPGLAAGDAGASVFGIDTRFRGAASITEAMLRFEQTQPDLLRFQGGAELSRSRIPVLEYLRGRRFVLPDRPVSALRVFVEADSGIEAADGRRYRELDLNRDAVVSLSQGTVRLRDPARGRVLATYTTESGAVTGDLETGRDFVVPIDELGVLKSSGLAGAAGRFDATTATLGVARFNGSSDPEVSAGEEFLERIGRRSGRPEQDALFVEIDGSVAALLYELGYFSPFERLDAYAVSRPRDAGEFPDIRFVRRDGAAEFVPDSEPAARFSPEGDELLFGSLDPGNPSARYPFSAYPALYGPAAWPEPGSAAAPFDILLEVTDEVDTIRLPSGVVPGSVEMTRNGIPDSRFDVTAGGRVSLQSPALPQDVLEFRFRTMDDGASSGTIHGAVGSRRQLSERSELAAGLSYTRDLSENPFTERANESVAETTGTLSWRFTGESLQAGAGVHIRARLPDTTGVRRLFDLDAEQIAVPAQPWLSLPGAEPAPALEIRDRDGGEIVAPAADETDRTPWSGSRGRLLFRDYQTEGGFRAFGSDLDPDREYAYEDGSLTGPYVASRPGTDGNDARDRALVLDYELDALDDTGQWVSAQLQFGPDTLTQAPGGMRFRLETAGVDGSVDIYLQLGATAEDLDGDGVTDRGRSALQPALDFTHSDEGITLLAGGLPLPDGRGQAAREDILQRGFLAAEDGNRIVTRRIATDVGSTDNPAKDPYVVLTFSAAEVQRMGIPRAARLVVVRTDDPAPDDEPASGAVLLSDIAFFSRPLSARSIDTSGNTTADPRTVSTTTESDLRLPDGTRLPESSFLVMVHPETAIFRSGTAASTTNRVLAVRADLLPDGGSERGVEVTGLHEEARLGEYERFVVYIHTGTVPEDKTVSVELSSGSDGRNAISATFNLPPSANWQRVEVNTSTGRVTRYYRENSSTADLKAEQIGTAELDRMTPIRRTSISLSSSAEDDWTVYLDEPHLAGSRRGLDGSFSADLSYQGPEQWFVLPGGVQAGRFTFDFAGTVDASRVDTGETPVRADTIRVDGSSGINLGTLRVELDADWVYAPPFDEQILLLGHGISTASPWHGLTASETYTRSMTGVGTTVEQHLLSSALSAAPWSSRASASRSSRNDRYQKQQSASFAHAPFTGSVGLAQAGRRDALNPDTPYLHSWMASFPGLLPAQDETVTRRTFEGRFALRPTFQSVSPSLALDSQWTALPAVPQLSANSGGRIELGLEAFGDSGVRLTPFYQRRLTLTETNRSLSTYQDDIGVVAESLGPQENIIYRSVPFLELFPGNASSVLSYIDSRRAATRYTPSAGIEFRRPFGTRLMDLVVPHFSSVEVAREYRAEDDSTDTTGRITLESRALAVNLFGSLGAYPLTDMFRTDEYESRIRVRLDYPDRLRDVFQQKYQADFEWRVFPSSSTEISLLNETTIDRGVREGFEHRTRLSATLEHDDSGFAEGIRVPLTYEQSRLRSEHDLELVVRRTEAPTATELLRITAGTRLLALYDNTLRITLGGRIGYEISGAWTDDLQTVERLAVELRLDGRLRF